MLKSKFLSNDQGTEQGVSFTLTNFPSDRHGADPSKASEALLDPCQCSFIMTSMPSEPREARRAKAEALMIMYFHVLNCFWLLGWFGDVLSCLGSMVLCSFALESFSRCCRSTLELASSNSFAAVGHGRDLSSSFATVGHGFALSNSFGAFRFQLLRFGGMLTLPFGRIQVSGGC